MSLVSQLNLGFQRLSAEVRRKPSLDAYGHLSTAVLRAPQQASKALQRTGALGETYSRLNGLTTMGGFSSQKPVYCPVFLLKGVVINQITFCSGTSGASNLTNLYYAIYDPALSLIATTPNDTTASWPGYTERTYSLSAPFTVQYDGLYFLATCHEGPGTTNYAGQTLAAPMALAPALCRQSSVAYPGGAAAAPTTSPAGFTTPQGLPWAWYS